VAIHGYAYSRTEPCVRNQLSFTWASIDSGCRFATQLSLNSAGKQMSSFDPSSDQPACFTFRLSQNLPAIVLSFRSSRRYDGFLGDMRLSISSGVKDNYLGDCVEMRGWMYVKGANTLGAGHTECVFSVPACALIRGRLIHKKNHRTSFRWSQKSSLVICAAY